MPEPLPHDQLPLPDYDHLTVGALPARISPLGEGEVQQLLDYERAHGNRLPVTLVLEQRLEALANGAATSSADPAATPSPETNVAPAGGSPVDPSTSGPPMNPPSHGDPTNPAQPR
jgi:hypothetical protein